MKSIKFFILFFSLVLLDIALISNSVYSISMNQMSPEDRLIVFEPNLQKDFSVNVFNAERVESFMYPGPLEPYATLIDTNPLGPSRSIGLRLSLPETLDPGRYEIFFGGREYRSTGGTVGGLAAVASNVVVLSLFPGKYPEFSITAPDVSNGDRMNFSITIDNFGTEDILAAYADVEVYDLDGNLITTIRSNSDIVYSKKNTMKNTIVYAELDSSKFNLKPGFFKGVATLHYDDQLLPEKKEATFRVGVLSVYIDSWTNQIYANVTNKFIIQITSDWTGRIEDVYAKIHTPNGVIKTPNLDLDKFQSATLETYWEAKKLEPDNYTVTIELFYSKTSTKKDVVVEVLAPIGPVEESPTDIPYLMIGGITVLVLLIIINLYIFIIRPKKGNGEGGLVNNFSNNSKDNNDVRPPKM